VEEVVSTVEKFKRANPDHFVVTFLHVGPNFQWQPYPEHEALLRNISAVCDLVWGTSSHHIQRFEVFKDTPIIYGLGDLLFRHAPGVDDWCPLYAIPCEQYRPELALSYKFQVVSTPSGPRVDLSNVLAFPSRHDEFQTWRVTAKEDIEWLENTLNEMSSPNGSSARFDPEMGAFRIKIHSLYLKTSCGVALLCFVSHGWFQCLPRSSILKIFI
jgi:poly-gamma-glutamate synthesis protein (capsule biosynthesis protein)